MSYTQFEPFILVLDAENILSYNVDLCGYVTDFV